MWLRNLLRSPGYSGVDSVQQQARGRAGGIHAELSAHEPGDERLFRSVDGVGRPGSPHGQNAWRVVRALSRSSKRTRFAPKGVSALNDSHCAFYEVRGVDSGEVRLWDIAGRREFQCWNSSGYAGRKGEVWFVRVLPPLLETGEHSVTMNSLTSSWREAAGLGKTFRALPAFQNRFQCRAAGLPEVWAIPGLWLEFVVQAYVNHTGNAIFVMGFPDRPDSMPHSEHCRKL